MVLRVKYTPKTIVPLLIKRLSQLVPDTSSGTIEDTTVFKSSKDFLTTLCGKDLFSDIFYGLITTLSDIIGDSPVSLEARPHENLETILVFMRLLACLTTTEWDAAVEDVQLRVPHIGPENDSDYLYDGRLKLYPIPPPELDPEIVTHGLELLMAIKSSIKLNYTVHHILALEIPSDQRSPNHSRLHYQQQRQQLKDIEAYVTEIDKYCEDVVFFLSATNWKEVYSYALKKLRVLKTTSTEDVESLPGLDILGLLYLDHDRLVQVLRDLEVIYPHTKRAMHRLVVKHFLDQSIMYWIMARSSDVVFSQSASSDIPMVADTLFDQLYKGSEGDKKSHTLWVFLSVLLVLMPDTLSCMVAPVVDMNHTVVNEKVRHVKSATKLVNKKQMFLEGLVKAFRSANPLDRTIAATCYLTICKAAASVYLIDTDNHLVRFSLTLYNDMLNAFFGAADRHMIYPNLDLLQSQFVSAFCYLSYGDIQADLIPVLKAPTAPVTFQRNIVRGFLNLHTLPAGPEVLHGILSAHKETVMELVTMMTKKIKEYDLGHQKSDPAIYELIAYTEKLAFMLLMSQPVLYYSQLVSENYHKITQGFTEAINSAITITYAPLRETVMSYCFDIIEAEQLWSFEIGKVMSNANHVVYHIFRGLGMNAKEVAHNIMYERDLNDEKLETDLRFLKLCLQARTDLINNYNFADVAAGDISKLENFDDRLKISRTVETCMLVCLCSNNIKNSKLALSNLYALTREGAAIENFERAAESKWSIMPNYNIYSEIASPTYVVTGPIAVQKRLFKWLQLIDDPSPAMVKAWALTYDRWILISVTSFGTDQEKQREWKSYSGFLCSLLSPLLNLDGHVRIPDNAHFKARQFLKEIIELLLSDSAYVRETVKEVLARDASPLVFHHVFKHLNDMIDSRLIGQHKVLDPKDIRLAVQTTSLITSVIERLYDGEVYLSVDIGALAIKIVRFLKNVESDADLVKLEIRICQLLEVVGFYKDTLNMKHELRVRNEFVLVLSEWLEKTTSSTMKVVSSDRSTDKGTGSRFYNEVDRLNREKTVAIVKALAQLLDGLPIDVPDGVHEHEALSAKCNVFSNLFALFLRVLNRVKNEEEGRSEGMLVLGDKVPFVRSQVIVALSNLLNANVDVGLKVALSLGYHDDLNLRLAFLEIFKTILTQGTKFSAEYNENKRYEELVDTVVSNRQIALILCEICPPSEVDEFSVALLNVFDSRNQCLALVKDVVQREIEKSDNASDVLRRNCVATKMLSLFAKSKGFHYLQLTLGPFLSAITSEPDSYVFEIEPDKLKDYQEFKDNMNNFDKCLSAIINALEQTVDSIPVEFRELSCAISSSVEPLFPEAKEAAVGAFFFLRFICPALVSPDGEGLVDKAPSKDVRRALLLLAKTIQNMANGSTNPVRLAIVSDRISKIEAKTKVLLNILRKICVVGDDHGIRTADMHSARPNLNSLERPCAVALHRFLFMHWEDAHHRILMDQRMRRLIASRSHSHSVLPGVESRRLSSALSDSGDLAASRKLTTIVRSLGRPTSTYSRQLPTSLRFNTPHRLYEFMARNSLRDLEPVIDKRIVHEGFSADGTPVLIMSGRNYSRDKTDTELVLYRFFQVASKMWSEKFYLFYDGTGYSAENNLPNTARTATELMIPDEMAHNCAGFFFYNVSSDQLPRVKALIRHYQNGLYLNPMRTEYIFLTPATIGDYFDVPQLNLDERSVDMISDIRYTFSENIQMLVSEKDEWIRVSIRVGDEYLQIRGETPFVYIPQSPGYTNDTYHLSEIKEIYMSGANEIQFTLEFHSGKKVILTHPRRYEIMRAIQNCKGKLIKEINKKPKMDGLMRVDDAMGRLLNMGLANLCSTSAPVQQAAYNLLATLPARFDINFGRELRGGEGLAIPKNEITMAVSFSEAVSLSHPDLTLEFLTEFFTSYKNFSVETRQSTILYAVPWIKNIYKYVFLADEEHGPEQTAKLIRQCLDITVGNHVDYNCLMMNVWPVLCLEEALVETLVEEVVDFVVGGGLTDYEDALAIVTSFPTTAICGTILMRIRRVLATPLGFAERSLMNHPNWTELVVLLKMISYLSFESILIAEVFLPEIFMLVTTFLYTGSYSFRASLHSLLINVVHSFSCSDRLDAEQKEHVVTVWHDLTSAKGKLLFGLSDEMRPTNYDYFVLAAVKHIESCCNLLMDVLSTVGTPDEANIWRARWSSFVMRACFIDCPALQCRSFLVLGCLARVEVEDVVVAQVLRVLRKALTSEMLSLSEEYTACILFCLTKMVDGLPGTSRYHARLFWLALAILRGGTQTLFSYATALLQATVRVLDENAVFKTAPIAEYLISARHFVEEEWQQIDELTHIQISEEFFEVGMCATLVPGLEKSITRASTLKCFETLLEVSAKNNVADRLSRRYPAYLSYLYFLYLGCRSEADMKDLLWVAGYPDMDSDPNAQTVLDGTPKLPSLLREYLSDDTAGSTVTLFLGAQLFRSCNEYDHMDLRFLESLRAVGEKNVEKKAMVYSMIRDKLIRVVEQGSNNKILEAVMNVGSGVLANVQLFNKLPIYRRKLQSLLVGNGFEGTLFEGPSGSGQAMNEEDRSLARVRCVALIDKMLEKEK